VENNEKTTSHIANDLLKAKRAETKAKEKRAALEETLFEMLKSEIPDDKKSKTINEDNFKIIVTHGKESYRLNQAKYIAVRNSIDASIRPEKIKFDLDQEGYMWLKKNKPEIFELVSDCVSMSVGKPTVKVEKI